MSERSMIDISASNGIVRVLIPLPFPLRYVNSYLIEGPDGWTVIDPGLRTIEAETLWATVLSQMGISYPSIHQIILTHHHPDHCGMAGWLQDKTGAPVRMSAKGWEQARHMWGEDRSADGELLSLFHQHGMEFSLQGGMRDHLTSFLPQVRPLPHVTDLKPDTEIQIGGDAWRVIETNGHAWGHLCFFQPGTREVFCGDHVLPRISPNISYTPGTDENPLASYFEALQRMASYEPLYAYPGHRDPFSSVGERTDELLRHHEQRLNRMQAMLATPTSAYDLSLRFFGKELTIHTLRFAVAETIAHLIYLEQTGQVQREESNRLIMYKAILP
ncbi:MAG: MBL fold metallo-hydrolase [Gorillibacterium sp.]|nr:MBL fold metallo-hydrolase [Gorillibacterium sp.]